MQKRSFTLNGHQTSVALEAEFWQALEQIANARQSSLPALIAKIDRQRSGKNLASALRVHALETTRLTRKILDPAPYCGAKKSSGNKTIG